MKNACAIKSTASLTVAAIPIAKRERQGNASMAGKGLISPILLTKMVFYGYAVTLIGSGFFMQDVARAPLLVCIMFYFLGGGCAVFGWHSKRLCQRNGHGR